MDRIKSFLKTTLIGGALVVLPIVVLLLVFNWLYPFIADKIKPITYILSETVRLQESYASISALLLIILSFFIEGIILKTKIGRFAFESFERKILTKKLTLYKIIKDTTE